jgi:hypothetical protein
MIKSLAFERLASFLGQLRGTRCTVFRLLERTLDLIQSPREIDDLNV